VIRVFTHTVLLLRSVSLTPKMGEQILKNIVHLSEIFLKCRHFLVPPEILALLRRGESVDEDEAGGDDVADAEADDANDDESAHANGRQAAGAPILRWMFDLLVDLLKKKDVTKNQCILHLIGAITTKIRSRHLHPYLPQIATILLVLGIKPTYKQLTTETKNLVVKAVGAVAFAKAEQHAIEEARRAREERKRLKLLAHGLDSTPIRKRKSMEQGGGSKKRKFEPRKKFVKARKDPRLKFKAKKW